MNTDKLSEAGAVFASSYIKRWLEKYYTEMMTWPVFQKVKDLGPTAKYVIEAGLFALTGYVSTKLDPKNPLTTTLVEVFKDAAPEITSRLMTDVRSGLSEERTLAASPYQSVASKMLGLDDTSLLSLLAWLETADEPSRKAFVTFAKNHEAQELTRFAGLATGQRETLLGAITGTKSAKWQAAKDFIKDFGRIVAAGAKKGAELSIEVIKRYTSGLVWLLKLCGVLWALGILCWQANALSAGKWSMFAMMLGLTAGCGGMIWWGRSRQIGWLTWAGIIGGSVVAILTLLTATGHGEAIPGLSFMFLLGFPSVAILVALAPLNAVLVLFKGLMPTAYATLSRVVQMVVVAFMGIVVFSVFLFLVPARGNPVAIFVLAPLAIVLTGAVGLRLINVDPDRFFGWPLKASLIFIIVVCFGALFIPKIKEHFAEAPIPVTYQSGRDIPFSDKTGHSMIWYAETHNGGFELFTAKSEGLYTPDGRKLRPADSENVRQSIRNWVDQETARSAAAKASRLAADEEANQRRTQAALQEQEAARIDSEKARRASYIDILPTTRVNYVVCAAHENGGLIPELSGLVVKGQKAVGKTASDTVFSQEFAKSALRPWMAGKGAKDLRAMEITKIADRLVLIEVKNERITESQRFANLRTASGTMTVTIIDPADGRKIDEYTIGDVSGAGVSDASAWAAFYERVVDELLKQAL
ncbi:MAG: hypothetical protein WCL71_03725 [Deltaproteobacteria bacterium]